MDVAHYPLFPTRLVTIQFPDTDGLNGDLYAFIRGRSGAAGGFDMHPGACNLLGSADAEPAIARLRGMFLEGLRRWLGAEEITGLAGVDLVLFSNWARRGELTLAHNHNADLVGIYYARTAASDRPPVCQPGEDDDYFEPGDGVLVLHDPRFNANLTALRTRDHVKIVPRPGLMLIFPGYVWHSVTPHLGDFHRLSFAINCTLRWPGASIAEHHPWA